ncbi:MAG: hypothetical protein RI963_175 [Planctomycetota bacterium]|jgi:hypothetical protein
MKLSRFLCFAWLAALPPTLLVSSNAWSANHYGLEEKSILLTSAGPLAFGPEGILFVSDPKSATIYAIDTKSHRPEKADLEKATYQLEDVQGALASLANGNAGDVAVADIAVDPEAGTLLMSVTLASRPGLAVVGLDGKANLIKLDKVLASAIELPNAPPDKVTGEGRRASNKRMESITDLAFSEGRLIVSGLAGENPLSTVRAIGFPFQAPGSEAQIEIFHAAHGRNEDYAAIRAFIPINIDGKPSLLAGFTCTPLVRFSLDSLQKGDKVRGTTVAELGNQNRPLDMIVYERDGKTFLLVTNTARGVMKIDTADVAGQDELTEPVKGGGTAGVPFSKVESMTGILQLAKLGETHGVILRETEEKRLSLATIELP